MKLHIITKTCFK